MTKLVGGQGRHPAGFDTYPVIGVGEGCGYVAAAGSAGTLKHEIATLEGVVSPGIADDPRPAVLMTTQLGGGAGEVAGWLLRELGDSFRFIVLVTDNPAGGRARRRALADLCPEVYPLASFLDPAVWPSVATDLVLARRVRTVLRIGRTMDLAPVEPEPFVVDVPLDRTQVGSGADLVLAVGRGIAEEAKTCGLEVEELIAAPSISGGFPETTRLAAVRSEYGIPEQSRLVLAVCDLEPDQRPEDVVAVAHRLRHREDLHFLLVGQGSLAGTVSDIAGYFQLDRFVFSPPGRPLVDLVAVADCVLSTAERDPWPATVAAALGLGRPLVATEVDGVRELVAASKNERCDLRPPGDVAGLAEAVVAAVDVPRRPKATKKAWLAAASRSEHNLGAVREVLGRRSAGGAKSG